MLSLPFSLERSITINKPTEDVFARIANFNSWQKWSPWLCQEPDCPVSIDGQPGAIGHGQSWDGKTIGSGEMRLVALSVNKRLDYDLVFKKPWKSRSKTSFLFEASGSGTKVTWTMRGSVPVFLFFLRKMMSAFVGNDYERGLLMLKEYLESGEAPTRLEIKGETRRQGFYYVGKETACGTKDVGPVMQKDFTELGQMIDKGLLQKPDFMFSFYRKFDIVNQRCVYVAGFGYQSESSKKGPVGMASGQVEEHRALQINHFGPYRFLGGAWSAVFGCQRRAGQKQSKTIPMYEVYVTMPGQVPEKEIRTEVFLPLR